jgi:hypothetical protein
VISFLLNSITEQPESRSALKLNSEDGFPHSEIAGSKPAHGSPTLIAACHVLHRLYMPRHPPNALTSRLRVHTTNDNIGIAKQSPLFILPLMIRIIISARLLFCFVTVNRCKHLYTATVSIKKPIHNVKDDCLVCYANKRLKAVAIRKMFSYHSGIFGCVR